MEKWRIFPISVLIIVFVIAIGNSILTSIIQKKMGQALRQLSPKILANYSSIHANLFTSSAFINNLNIHFVPYSNNPQYQYFLHFNKVTLAGINLFKVIFSNTVSIRETSFDKVEIRLDQFLLNKKDSGQEIMDSLHIPFKNIAIANLKFSETTLWLHSPHADQILLKGNVALLGAEINIMNKPVATNSFRFTGAECSLSDINFEMAHAPYSILIKKLLLNSMQHTLLIDSIHIIPRKESMESLESNKGQIITSDVTATKLQVTKFNMMQLFVESTRDKDSSAKDLDSSTVLINDLNVHLKQYDKRQEHQYSFYCKHFTLMGMDLTKAIFNDNVFINMVKLDQCDIKIDRSLLNKNEILKRKILSQLNVPFRISWLIGSLCQVQISGKLIALL